MSRSAELWARARAVLPGGVNSPVRAFRAVGGSPFFVSRARGARLWTVDGQVLLDYVLSWGPLLLGHDPPEVRAALTAALERGWTYGAPCEAEVLLAEEVGRRMPSLEMVRFVNSGTEAAMAALRLARAATGREKILKFDGCYHGHADAFLVRAGSGVATLGLPDSPGVPPALAALTLTAPFNDLEQAVAIAEREELAAIIVEPFVGNAGFIPPRPGFLEGLRDVSTRTGALLVFDEVMTGFRVHAAGAQGLTGVSPDLTILGKVIGGGLPVGAFGGSRRLMELVAPQGPVYQAGTLSGNPLAMAAGLATLRAAATPAFYDRLEARAQALLDGLGAAAGRVGVPFTGAARGGMFGFFFHPGPVDDFAAARRSDTALFARFHHAALTHGVFLAPSAFEAGFVSHAHTDADIDETIAQLDKALAAAGS